MPLPKTPVRPVRLPSPSPPLPLGRGPPVVWPQLWRRPGALAAQASLAAAAVALAAAGVATLLLAHRRRVDEAVGGDPQRSAKRGARVTVARLNKDVLDWRSGALWKAEAERRLHEGYTSFLYSCL
jgi:hypothetical protein